MNSWTIFLIAVVFLITGFFGLNLMLSHGKMQEGYHPVLRSSGLDSEIKPINTVKLCPNTQGYFSDLTEVCWRGSEIPGVDASTFRPIDNEFAVDGRRAYWIGIAINGADASSFEIADDGNDTKIYRYARDKNNVYIFSGDDSSGGWIIDGAATTTFEFLGRDDASGLLCGFDEGSYFINDTRASSSDSFRFCGTPSSQR